MASLRVFRQSRYLPLKIKNLKSFDMQTIHAILEESPGVMTMALSIIFESPN
jgi:hypothetical protein